MSEYPDNVPWFDVLIMCAHLLAEVILVLGVVYWFTHITPEREAELKAEGAAAFDAKVERAGGWEKWIAGEIAEVR